MQALNERILIIGLYINNIEIISSNIKLTQCAHPIIECDNHYVLLHKVVWTVEISTSLAELESTAIDPHDHGQRLVRSQALGIYVQVQAILAAFDDAEHEVLLHRLGPRIGAIPHPQPGMWWLGGSEAQLPHRRLCKGDSLEGEVHLLVVECSSAMSAHLAIPGADHLRLLCAKAILDDLVANEPA